MSALAHRLSRSKSRSPQHSPSSSPRRKPLHERTNSDTNSIAGSASTGPPPLRGDDSDPVFSSSPFPRLPSHVLLPRTGSTFIFEDSTATRGNDENAGAAKSPSAGSSLRSRPKSPLSGIKGRRSPRQSPRSSLEAARSRPASAVGRNGRIGARDMTRPLDEVRRTKPARTNSRVRSIVNAIESSSVKSQSPPSTPRTPRTRSVASRASIASRRFEVGSRDRDAVFDKNAPVLSTPRGAQLLPSSEQLVHSGSPVLFSGRQTAPEPEDDSMRPPKQLQSSGANRAVSADVRPPTSSSTVDDNRPRSSSNPGSPTETFLAALIASGAIQYPSLDKPSLTTLRTDSSSIRQAVPQPLQLRRQPALSNLALAQGSTGPAPDSQRPAPHHHEELNLGDDRSSIASFEVLSTRPSTPQHQIIVHPPSSGRWTPGRWDSEMEDDVPELQPRPLRAPYSYRDSGSQTSLRSQASLRRAESIKSFQSTSSTSLPFYNFLNDSKTAWARAYYRGEGALRIMTPPSVTMVRALSVRSARSNVSPISPISPMTPSSRHSRSISESGADRTPDSESYPQEVFIPRLRPFPNQVAEPQRRLPPIPLPPQEDPDYTDYGVDDQVPTPAVTSKSNEETSAGDPGSPESLTRDPTGERRFYGVKPEDPIPTNDPDTPSTPLGNQRPPALSPDRGNNNRISMWRPPSIERQSVFGTVNRQILLFCLGFCFPFAWMLAAFLPLPIKPPVLSDDPEISSRPQSVADLNEMFNQQDVRRYQKARWWRVLNRAMSVVGTFVIAAIVRFWHSPRVFKLAQADALTQIALAIVGTR
ncbi:MAG: hypothetical protein Q9162_004476 [Coniocarpon cinnabarinum]